MIKSLEPNIKKKQALSLYKKISEDKKKTSGFSFDKTAEAIMFYKIGGYGNFLFAKYIEEKREEYKQMKKSRAKWRVIIIHYSKS